MRSVQVVAERVDDTVVDRVAARLDSAGLPAASVAVDPNVDASPAVLSVTLETDASPVEADRVRGIMVRAIEETADPVVATLARIEATVLEIRDIVAGLPALHVSATQSPATSPPP